MEAVNPLWNSNTTIHIGVIAIPRNVHTINAMPFVPFCFAYEADRNDSSTKLRSIGQHFGNGLHQFVSRRSTFAPICLAQQHQVNCLLREPFCKG